MALLYTASSFASFSGYLAGLFTNKISDSFENQPQPKKNHAVKTRNPENRDQSFIVVYTLVATLILFFAIIASVCYMCKKKI